jgi:ferric-dicitrate binding protein FerR (iron transport regulator)
MTDQEKEILYALIISLLSGNITEEERSSLHMVLADSEEARLLYEKMCNVLTTPEAERAIAGVSLQPPPIPRGFFYRYRARMITVAAIVLVMAGTFGSIWQQSINRNKALLFNRKKVNLSFDNGETVVLNNADTTIVLAGIRLTSLKGVLTYTTDFHNKGTGTLLVPAGKYYSMKLSDGTKVTMSAATTISFPFIFHGKFREVSVDGQALFEVAKNDAKPFIVHLPGSTVKVLGTKFSVNTYDKKEIVSLVTGSVNVIRGHNIISLKPSTEVIMLPDSSPKISRFTVENVIAQEEGICPYYNIRLDELANYISRCYDVEVKIKNPVGGEKFYGAIDQNEPISEFLGELTDLNKALKYSMNGNTVYIINN